MESAFVGALLSGMNELRAPIHLLLHVLVPALIAWLFAKGGIKHAFFIMMATMVVDLDHLLAVPIYAANRCSIWFHPLHTALPILIYLLMMCWPLVRSGQRSRIIGWIGAGLVIHMALDAVDCLWMSCAL